MDDPKKILVLGAGGMLGHKACQLLSRVPGWAVVGTVRGPADACRRYPEVFGGATIVGGVDVLDESGLDSRVRELEPDVILNAVGIVKQRDEASDRALSVAVNTCLPHRLARLAGEVGGRLIHIGTDCVFDGERGRYTEDDPSDARDLYGQSKYLGETDGGERAAVTLRTSIIGRELKRPTHGLVEWFLSCRGGSVRGFDRAVYTGFTTQELCRVIRLVIEDAPDLCGTWHVASAPITKYILLHSINRTYGLTVEIERDERFRCDRSLLMDRFSSTTGYVAPSWDEMITEMHEDPTPYDAWQGAA